MANSIKKDLIDLNLLKVYDDKIKDKINVAFESNNTEFNTKIQELKENLGIYNRANISVMTDIKNNLLTVKSKLYGLLSNPLYINDAEKFEKISVLYYSVEDIVTFINSLNEDGVLSVLDKATLKNKIDNCLNDFINSGLKDLILDINTCYNILNGVNQQEINNITVISEDSLEGRLNEVFNKINTLETTLSEVVDSGGSMPTTIEGYGITDVYTKSQVDSKDNTLNNKISVISSKIPSQASTTNQLADKDFVNSSIQTNTANFRGNWGTWDSVPTSASSYPLDSYSNRKPTVNDYMVVQDTTNYNSDTKYKNCCWRFKYNGSWDTNGKNGWQPEYRVNEEPFTAAQLKAINSNITADLTTDFINVRDSMPNYVLKTTKINGKALSADISLTYTDVGASPSSHTHDDRYYTESEINGKIDILNTSINGKAASSHTHNYATPASITAGTVGTNSDTSGSSLAVPYVTMNAQGIVTGYGIHTHTVTGFGNASLTSSDFCGSEKVYNQGSTASINLSNGRIFYCTGSSITLPSAVNGVCITCIVTASSVTWGGSIVWKGNKAPTLTANVDLVSFLGYNNSWYGA